MQPVCQKLPPVLKAIDEIEDTLDISSEARADIANLIKYFKSFKAIILTTTWFKILKSIDMRTKVLQLRNTTIDAEVRNLDSLLDEMRLYRDSCASILEEASLVADELHVPKHLKENRRQSNASLSPSEVQEKAIADFKINVYITVIDRVIAEISRRFKSTTDICKRFSFLWLYPKMKEEELAKRSAELCEAYKDDISPELSDECLFLKRINSANIADAAKPDDVLQPLQLLNKLVCLKLQSLFPNIFIALRLFLTLPVSVASAERSFSKLKLIKELPSLHHRSKPA